MISTCVGIVGATKEGSNTYIKWPNEIKIYRGKSFTTPSPAKKPREMHPKTFLTSLKRSRFCLELTNHKELKVQVSFHCTCANLTLILKFTK